MGGISRGDSDMIRLLTSPCHHFIALAGLLFLAAIGHASEPQEPIVENTLEPNPSISQLYSRQLEDYQSGRGDSNRNEMAKKFHGGLQPIIFWWSWIQKCRSSRVTAKTIFWCSKSTELTKPIIFPAALSERQPSSYSTQKKSKSAQKKSSSNSAQKKWFE